SVSEQFKEEKAAKSSKAAELPQVEQDIRKEIERLHLQDAVDVRLDAEGVSVEFKDQLLFEPGAADLKASYVKTAQNILSLVAKANPKYRVTIEGHTDDTPLLPGSKYPTNWELSAARGISLLNHLASLKIASSRMRVVSYADTQPKASIKGRVGDEL